MADTLQLVDVAARALTGVATATISYLLYKLNSVTAERLKRVQDQDEIERTLRRQLSLDIKMEVDVTGDSCGGTVIAVRIQIKNISRNRWCVPAVFLDVRSFTGKPTTVFLEADFDALPRCVGANGPCFGEKLPNLAHVMNSIKHLSPDETETAVCSFVLDQSFLEQNPVLIFRSRVFGAGNKELGPDYLEWNLRNEWIAYAQKDGKNRRDYCFIDRRGVSDTPADYEGVGAGRWYLMKAEAEDNGNLVIDTENTKLFLPVLRTMSRWHQYATVNLSPHALDYNGASFAATGEPIEGPPLGVSPKG